MRKVSLLLFVLFISATTCFAQVYDGRFQTNGFSLPYKVSFPDNYDPEKQYPLLIFLHGAGERGNDNEKQLVHGKEFLFTNTQKKFPAILLAPQCSEYSYWSNVQVSGLMGKLSFTFGLSDEPTSAMDALIALTNDWLKSGKVDTTQVYLGGLSMGGMGTFELLWRMPETFAAAFPICGGGDSEKVSAYANNTAVWIFHGENDSVVPASNSHIMHEALKAAGCAVKYTGYEGVDHNSWDNVFAEEELFPWLFNHKK